MVVSFMLSSRLIASQRGSVDGCLQRLKGSRREALGKLSRWRNRQIARSKQCAARSHDKCPAKHPNLGRRIIRASPFSARRGTAGGQRSASHDDFNYARPHRIRRSTWSIRQTAQSSQLHFSAVRSIVTIKIIGARRKSDESSTFFWPINEVWHRAARPQPACASGRPHGVQWKRAAECKA